MRATRVELGESHPRVVPELEGRDAVLLRHWLSFDVGGPLLTIVADDGGRRRPCSHETAACLEALDEAREGLADPGAPGVATL